MTSASQKKADKETPPDNGPTDNGFVPSGHKPTEVHVEAETSDGGPVAVHAAGGRVVINTHGEATLDRDQVGNLIRVLNTAFQAVA